MRYIVALAAGLFLAIFDVSLMPYFQVLGVTPNFVLIFAASWAVVRGREEAFVIIPLIGFIRDLVTSDPLGTSAVAMTPIVLLAAAAQLRSMDTDFLPAIAVVASGTVSYGIISIIVLAATGSSVGLVDGLLNAVLPLAIVNALFTPIIYLPLHWLGTPSTMRILGPGRIAAPP